MADSSTSPYFPIRTVSNLTGVNSVTLRAWERRYQLITPQRTPKGHRLYTQQDIDNIRKILKLLDQGISISQVKPMLDQPLPDLTQARMQDNVSEWESFQQRILQAIYQFDEQLLDDIYNDALSLYPQSMVINQLITPLLKTLGQQWSERDAGIAEEHFFSVYLRNKIGARLQHITRQGDGPRLLIACMPDEYHEVGMLLFCLAIISYGYRVSAFGANLPLEQVPHIVAKKSFDGVVLSATSRIGKKVTDSQLPILVNAINLPVFVGGTASTRQETALQGAGAIVIGDELSPAIEIIGKSLHS